MKKIALHWQILISLVLAVLLGLIFKEMAAKFEAESTAAAFINGSVEIASFLGKLFMSALKMIIVPLIVSSVIAGLAGLAGIDRLKQLGAKTMSFYLFSTLIAATVGLLMVNTIQPGLKDGKPNAEIQKAFVDAEQQDSDSAHSKSDRFSTEQQSEAKSWKQIFIRMFPPNIIKAATDNGQLLGLLVFSLLFGIAATQVPQEQMATAVSYTHLTLPTNREV